MRRRWLAARKRRMPWLFDPWHDLEVDRLLEQQFAGDSSGWEGFN
jgi:hypothetical protein